MTVTDLAYLCVCTVTDLAYLCVCVSWRTWLTCVCVCCEKVGVDRRQDASSDVRARQTVEKETRPGRETAQKSNSEGDD